MTSRLAANFPPHSATLEITYQIMVWTTCSSFPVQPISTTILFCLAAKQQKIDNGLNLWNTVIIGFMIQLAFTWFWNMSHHMSYPLYLNLDVLCPPSIHFNWKGVSAITKARAREIMFLNKDNTMSWWIECLNNLPFLLVMTIRAWDGGESLKCIWQQRWVSLIE